MLLLPATARMIQMLATIQTDDETHTTSTSTTVLPPRHHVNSRAIGTDGVH
jgi:hypothetical protein